MYGLIHEDGNNLEEVIQMEEVCLNYIKEHIANVQKAYYEYFYNKPRYIDGIGEDEFRSYINSIKDAIENHDVSKFEDIEFYAYRREYNPTEFERKQMENDPDFKALIDEEYDKAWKHHFMNNDHHPKFWKVIDGEFSENNPPKDMTLGAIIHMICDWEAMSMYYGSDTLDWYKNKAKEEKNDMSEKTRDIVEQLLEQIHGEFTTE
ncbi:MAG: DUF5662 family protein [Lachnospiraceae bacterium]|nr:DUF5662 family protein [Lachnospiraceae bacterium]